MFKYYKNLKIGEKIPFELALNKSQYINKNQKVNDQFIADSGYGQGQILMNPLQLASIYSAFVNEWINLSTTYRSRKNKNMD